MPRQIQRGWKSFRADVSMIEGQVINLAYPLGDNYYHIMSEAVPR